MTTTVTIPLDAALAIATANGWTYNEATGLLESVNGDTVRYDDPVRAMTRVLAAILGNAVNTVPYTRVEIEVTVEEEAA